MWLLRPNGWLATFSRLYVWGRQRHYQRMFKLDSLIELVGELIRVLFVDGLSELVRKLAGRLTFRSRLRDMNAIRRHVHHRCRKRLLSRLSTRNRKRRPS